MTRIFTAGEKDFIRSSDASVIVKAQRLNCSVATVRRHLVKLGAASDGHMGPARKRMLVQFENKGAAYQHFVTKLHVKPESFEKAWRAVHPHEIPPMSNGHSIDHAEMARCLQRNEELNYQLSVLRDQNRDLCALMRHWISQMLDVTGELDNALRAIENTAA